MKEIWVVAECINQTVASSYYELLSKANELANDLGDTQLCAVVLGNDNQRAIVELKESGAHKVYSAEHQLLGDYNSQAYAEIVTKLVETYKPEMLIVPASGIGSELAPTVAGKLKTGLAAHCVDLRIDKTTKRINCMVPAFGGKVISEIYVPNTRPVMASVRPGILESINLESQYAEIVKCDTTCLDEFVLNEEFLELEEIQLQGQSLESASFVLAAGRGVNAEGYEYIKQIAEKTEAAIGYTRSFVDAGYVQDETNLIGTSGKSVKPKVLLEFGISGAVHYISGINKSKVVISVDNDEKSKIFDVSDYGAVADSTAVLKELAKRF